MIREEGSNGDREMAAAVYSGGMEPWDVTMSDLLNGRASLDSFQGKLVTLQHVTSDMCIDLTYMPLLVAALRAETHCAVHGSLPVN